MFVNSLWWTFSPNSTTGFKKRYDLISETIKLTVDILKRRGCNKHATDWNLHEAHSSHCFGFNAPWWWASNTTVHFLRYGSSLQRSCSTSNTRAQRKLTCLSGGSRKIDGGCSCVFVRYFRSCSGMAAPNQVVMMLFWQHNASSQSSLPVCMVKRCGIQTHSAHGFSGQRKA